MADYDTEQALGYLSALYPQLSDRRSGLDALDAYYSGDHPLPFLTPAHAEKMRTQFRQMLEESRSNFMRLLVDVVDERLQVEGFRLSADSSAESDKDTWDVWQANQLDSLSRSAHLDALIKGVSYASVWEDADGDGFADIAIEDACETVIAYTPGSNFRRRDAALKSWVSGQTEHATIYLPDGVYRFERRADDNGASSGGGSWSKLTGSDAYSGGTQVSKSSSGNPWKPASDGEVYVPNKLGIVPIVPLRNRGRVLTEGESELADVWQIQNQINAFIFLLMLGGYFGAHRQRYAAGIKLMLDEASGQVKEPFDTAIDKLWATENPDAKFGEFGQTDLKPYLDAIDQKVAHLAVVSRTPKHYLLPTGQDPSGDAIKSAESGLVRKIERKQDSFGEGWEEVMRLARMFQGSGEDASDNVDSEVVWADANTEAEAARTDATIKKFGAGLIPKEQALEDLGYSQTNIARIMAMEAAERLAKQVAAPDPTSGKITLDPGDQSVDPGDTTVTPQTVKA